MRIGSDYYGIIIERDFLAISIYPFSFDIFILNGIEFKITVLDTYISLGMGIDYIKKW